MAYQPPTILIVEDDLPLSKLYSTALTNKGYRVENAFNGQKALELLEKGLPIDLILLDIIMPMLDGIELLKILKKPDSNYKNIPVYMLTNMENKETIQEAMDNGANGYFLKMDKNPSQLISEIEKHLKAKLV